MTIRSIFGRAAMVALAGSLTLATASRCDDKPKTQADKKAAASDYKIEKPVTLETCKLPDGDSKDLLKFAAPGNLMKIAQKNGLGQADYMKFRGYVWKLVGDRITGDSKATEKERNQAAMLGLQGRASLASVDPKNHAKDLAAAVAKIKEEKPNSDLAYTASAILFQVNYLSGRSLKKDAPEKLFELAKDEPKNPNVGRLISGLYRTLQSREGDDAAVSFLEKAIKEFPKHPDAKSWKGRLQSRPGQVMTVAGPTLTGTDFDFSSLRGKVVLIDFWATWCGPCIAEIPNVKETYEKLHKQGFEIVGVSLDQSRDKLEKFVKEKEMSWPQIIFADDKDLGWNNPVAKQYGIDGIPAMFLIGKDGKVVKAQLRGEGALEKAVEQELAKPKPTLN